MKNNSGSSSNHLSSCNCGHNHSSLRKSKTSIYPEDVSGVVTLFVLVANLWGFIFFCGWVSGEENILSTRNLVIAGVYLNLVYLSYKYVKNYLRDLVIVGGENSGATKKC